MEVGSAADPFDLRAVKGAVQEAIESYKCPPGQTAGNAWTNERVVQELQLLRDALIDPYWTDVERRDTFEQVGMERGPLTRSVAVADDGVGTILLFDPDASEYLLAVRAGRELVSIGVSGDAIGCFFAR